MATKKPSRSYYDIKLSESKELKRFQKLAGIKPSRLLNEQVTLGQAGVYEPEEDPIESFELEGVPEAGIPADLDIEAMASAERLTTSGAPPGITDVQPAEIDDSISTPEEAEGASEGDAVAREAETRSRVTNTRETYVDVIDARLGTRDQGSSERESAGIGRQRGRHGHHSSVRSAAGHRPWHPVPSHVGEDRDTYPPSDLIGSGGVDVETATEIYRPHYDEWRGEEVSRLVDEHKQATGYPPQDEAWISDEDYLSQFGDQIEGIPPAEYVYDPDDLEMNAEGGILHRRANRLRSPANMEIISVCPGSGAQTTAHEVQQEDPRCRGSVSTSGNRVVGRFYDEEDQTWYHVAFNHLAELPDVEIGQVIQAGDYIGSETLARIADKRGDLEAGQITSRGSQTGTGGGPHLHMGMWVAEGDLAYNPDSEDRGGGSRSQVPSEYSMNASVRHTSQPLLDDGTPDPNYEPNPVKPGQWRDRRLRAFTNFLMGKQLSTETYEDPGLSDIYTGQGGPAASDFRAWINEKHPEVAANYCPEGMECVAGTSSAPGIGTRGGANVFTESALDHQVPIEQDDGSVVMTALGDLYMQDRLAAAEGNPDVTWKRHVDGSWWYLASDGRYYPGGQRASNYMAAAHPAPGVEPPTTAMMDAEEEEGGAIAAQGAPAELSPEDQDAVADAAENLGLTRESLSLGSKKDLLLEKRHVVRFQQLAGIKPSRILAEQISFDQAGVKLPEKKPIEPVKPAEPVEPTEPVDDTGEVFEFDVESDLTEFDPLNPIDPDKFQYDYDDEWEDFDRGSTAIEPPEIQAEPIEVSPDAWKTEAHDFDATAGFTTAGQITRAEALASVYDGSGTKKEQHSEADDFRQWVNTSHPSIASALKLDKAGPRRGSNNVTAQNAFGHIFDHDGDASTPEVTLGDLYRQEVLGTTAQAGDAELVKAYRGANTELRDFLDAGQRSPGAKFSLNSVASPWKNRHTLDASQLSLDSGMNEAVIYAIASNEGQADDLAFECSQALPHSDCRDKYGGYALGKITRTNDIEMLRKAIKDNPTKAGKIIGRTSFGYGQVLGSSGSMDAYAKALGHASWDAAVKDAATKGKTEKDVALDMVDWFEKDPAGASAMAFVEFTTVRKPKAVKAANRAARTDKAEDWYDLAAQYNGFFWTRSDVLNLMTHRVKTGVDAKGNDIMERQWDPAKFKGGVVPSGSVSGSTIRKLHGNNFAGMQAFEKTLTAAALKDYRDKRYDTDTQRKFKEGTGLGVVQNRIVDPAALSISESDFRTAYWEAKRTNPSVTSQQVLDGLIAAHYGGATPKRDDEVYRESKLRKAIKSAILKEKVRSAILKELTGGPSMPGGLLYPIPPQVRQDYDKHVHQKLLDRAHSDRESRMDDMVGRQSVSPGYSEEAMLSQAQYDKDYSDVHSGASDSAFAQSDVDEYELDPSIESDAGLPGDAVASLAPALKSAGRTYSTPEEYRYFRSRTATPMEEGIKIKVVRKWSEEPCELPTIDEQVDATDITRRLQGRSSGTRTGEEGGMTRADWQDSGDARTPRREFAEPEMTEDGFLIYNSDVGENPRIVYVFPGVVKGGVNRARDMTADRVKANLSAYPNTIVVVAPTHKTSWESLRSVGETALGGRTPSSKRLVGHSGGARGVKDALRSGDEFDKITYADPEAAHLMGRDFDHSRSTMHYNPENWSEKLGAHTTDLAGEMGEDRAHLSDRLEDEGGWEHHWRIFDDALSDSMFDEEDERATQYLRRPELEPVVYQTTGPTLPPTETLHEDASDEDLPYYVAAPSTNDGREVIDQVTKAGPTGFDIASRFAPPKVRAAKTAFDFGYGTGTAINKAMGGIDADASDIDWGYAGTQAKGLASDAWKGVKGAFKLQEAYTQNVYEIECSIRIDKKKGGDKEETLTDIRGIPGVTIVGVVPGSSKESSNYFISTLLLKFEQNNNIPPRNYIKRTLTPGLRKIPGVGNFKVKRVKHISKAAD